MELYHSNTWCDKGNQTIKNPSVVIRSPEKGNNNNNYNKHLHFNEQ